MRKPANKPTAASRRLLKQLTQIAERHLRIETLETRNWDRLDFHEVGVWCLRDALEAAFQAGVEQGRKESKPNPSEKAGA
ncbi:DUF6900 domain-containing protein [Ralstonia pseudosolanacearum]|uniref:DUF6900 domain-containing protein n=1 Tax=Ralstonia pseudosolanacearum TaxID=1310165 RepID=UPI00223448D2|nr:MULTISPECIES: hypothetical protein [Ralstonia]MDO3518728.1 hypothetical protein [Ralstonia pseudosolanacearum]MDO3544251.1 hypothetical protein [Ralstonia pseudosolanacearum]UZF35837.1 hypothetical protein LGV81_03915 [Ralstonia sp. RS647]